MLKLTAIGNLGKDATINTVNGKNVINFSVAHTEKYNDKEKTTWIECAYWSEKTGIVPYLKKGQQVYIEGQPEVRTWESNGKTGASLSVRIISVQLLGNGSKQEAQPINEDTRTSYAKAVYPADDSKEELPF